MVGKGYDAVLYGLGECSHSCLKEILLAWCFTKHLLMITSSVWCWSYDKVWSVKYVSYIYL